MDRPQVGGASRLGSSPTLPALTPLSKWWKAIHGQANIGCRGVLPNGRVRLLPSRFERGSMRIGLAGAGT